MCTLFGSAGNRGRLERCLAGVSHCVRIGPLVVLCVLACALIIILCEWVARASAKQKTAASAKGDDNQNNAKHSKQFLILFWLADYFRFIIICFFFVLRWRCRCGFLFVPPQKVWIPKIHEADGAAGASALASIVVVCSAQWISIFRRGLRLQHTHAHASTTCEFMNKMRTIH